MWRSSPLLAVTTLICLCQVTLTFGITRKYFIAVNDVEWDYAPGGKNLIDPNDQTHAEEFLNASSNRIGGKYMKAIYFGYTDATFNTEIPKPASLGLLGPTIRGEVGDVIEIVFFNNASSFYSVHPHGIFYKKEHEGALYLDGSSGRYKNDDVVFPGDKVQMRWEVREQDAPGPRDPNCIPWVYHSHVNTVKDTSAGVMGTIVTCRKGILDSNNERTDVKMEYPLLVKIYDENLSWLLDTNIQRYCLDAATCDNLKGEDDDFINSNYMRSINGYMFGHLPGLTACVNDKVQFYLIGMGNEFDVHSLYFHGMSLKYQHTRGDTVSVYTATFVAAETIPALSGEWLISDVVDENEKGGMSAIFHTTPACGSPDNPNGSNDVRLKWFYLAAQNVTWDYGRGGVDHFTGLNLTDPTSMSASLFEKSSNRIGGIYTKARFFQYTDSSFTTKVNRPSAEDHMGIMGPVLRAEPGDLVQVVLKNEIDKPISLLPHGFASRLVDEPGHVGIADIGATVIYSFLVPKDILADVTDDCLNFLYTSASDSVQDHNAGLVGQILICRKDYQTNSQPKPKEVFLLLTAFDENKSFYIDQNMQTHLSVSDPSSLKSDEDFMASNVMFSVNGFSFATLPDLNLCLGENVTWYVAALGSELDIHPLTFDGNTFSRLGTNRDVQSLVSGSTAVLHMTPDNMGEWLAMSNSNMARDGGAYCLYTVTSCPGSPSTTQQQPTLPGKQRQFYVAAEEVEWNYTPLERALIDGMDLNDPRNEGNIFVKDDEDFIGNVYRKAVFREYTDFTFSVAKTRDVYENHLDILGPVMRAEVGDTITVFFKNLASVPYSMHPHGLLYSDTDSGRPYNQTKGVAPGRVHFYTWQIPERSGPGPNDPNCIPWFYYSAVNPTKDTNSGLVGPILICRPGTLDQSGKRTDDVDREMFVQMSVINENLSWYLNTNVLLYAPGRNGTDFRSDPDFEESNKMHSINGRLFGNNPHFIVEFNTSVTWYFMSLGSEIDLHTIHTHGNTFLHNSEGHRDDVISMFPGMAEAVSMEAVNPGTWLLHCHVLDHIGAGMETTYTVLSEGELLQSSPAANTHIG